MLTLRRWVCALWIGASVPLAAAAVFPLPDNGDTVVGQPRRVRVVDPANTLFDLARHYNTGLMEITLANPGLGLWSPAAADSVLIPSQYVLPPKPWRGIVVNLPQRRLFYFPPAAKGEPRQVVTVPLGIAREGWTTPLGDTRLVSKIRDPGWTPPDSIKAEHLAQGDELPDYVPPGEDNPMGMLAFQTGFKSIFLHGTNKPWGLGTRASHGCLHLYPENAAELFELLPRGTPIRIRNAPLVAGILDGEPVMVSYPTLDEYDTPPPDLDSAQALLAALPLDGSAADADVSRLARLLATPTVLPVGVRAGTPSLAERLAEPLPLESYTLPPYGEDANKAQVPSLPDAGGR